MAAEVGSFCCVSGFGHAAGREASALSAAASAAASHWHCSPLFVVRDARNRDPGKACDSRAIFCGDSADANSPGGDDAGVAPGKHVFCDNAICGGNRDDIYDCDNAICGGNRDDVYDNDNPSSNDARDDDGASNVGARGQPEWRHIPIPEQAPLEHLGKNRFAWRIHRSLKVVWG